MTVTDWEARRILDDLRRDTAPTTHWDTFTNRLDQCLQDYANRRTIQAYMIRDVAALAYGHVAEQLAAPQAEREAQLQKLVGAIERAETRAETHRVHNEQLERALSEKRTLTEQRKAAADPDDTEVIIGNDYRGWSVAQLEEIAYRLRSGGAVDDTPVAINDYRATAVVPAPNLVTLTSPASTTHVDAPQTDTREQSGAGKYYLMLVALVTAIVLVSYLVAR